MPCNAIDAMQVKLRCGPCCPLRSCASDAVPDRDLSMVIELTPPQSQRKAEPSPGAPSIEVKGRPDVTGATPLAGVAPRSRPRAAS